MSGLGDLGDGINQAPLFLDGDEAGCRWQITIPKIVLDHLKMPNTFASFCLQRDQRISEQIVTHAIGSIEIKGCRAGWDEDQTLLLIQTDSTPTIGAARVLPGILGPGLVAKLPWF